MTPASPKIKTAARVSPYRLAHSLRDWAHGSGSSQAPVELRLRRLGLDRDARRPTAAEVRLRKTRQAVHEKWLAMTAASRRGPVAPTHPRLSEYLERWLNESVRPTSLPRLSPTMSSSAGRTSTRIWGRNGSTGLQFETSGCG